MKQNTRGRISILSLILLAVSVVIAAFAAEKSDNSNQHLNSADDGTLVSNSGATPGAGGILSCIPDQQDDAAFTCHFTEESLTVNSEVLGFVTAGNTSLSESGPGHEEDTTSV